MESPRAHFGMAHFLLAAVWGSWEGDGFEVHSPKVGFYPQSVVNPHLGLTVFAKGISQGPACAGPSLQQLKIQNFRRLEWYSLSLPGCWRVSGVQYLLILLFDLHSGRGEGAMATSEQKREVLCKDRVLIGVGVCRFHLRVVLSIAHA